jgi:hypothetical protein
MTKILEAALSITAQDKTAGGLDSVEKRLNGVIKRIDDFRKVQSRFAEARGKFRDAQKAVEATARAMASVEKPTKAMQQELKNAQRAVSAASKAFEAQKNIIVDAKRELEQYGVVVTRLAESENRLRSAAAQAGAVQERQARSARRWASAKELGGMAGTAAGLYAGHVTHEVGREAIKATAEGAHERTRMEASGMTAAEIQEAEELSARLTGKFKSVGQTRILHLLRNARSIVGNYEEAGQIIEPLLQTYVVAQGAHPERSQELGEDFDKLVKGMEIKGVTQDLPKFKHYLDNMAKALNVFGDTLRPTDYYETFKYGRAATNALSDEFMLEVAPTFAQEMGGSSAGKAMSTFYGTLIGGKMKDVAAKEFVRLGLADPSKILRTKTGAVKGLLPNGIASGRMAAENPYEWVNKVLLPSLEAHGITDPDKIKDEIAVLFRDSTAAQMVSVLATQQSRIEKDRNLIRGAKGNDAAELFASKDPYIAMSGVTEQFKNLLQAAGSPLAETAANMLNRISEGLVHLGEAARDNPKTAAATLGGTMAVGTAAGAAGTWGAFKLLRSIFAGGGSDVLARVAVTGGEAGGGFIGGTLLPIAALTAGILAASTKSGDVDDKDARRLRAEDEALARARGGFAGGDATLNVRITLPDGVKGEAQIENNITGLKIGTTGSVGKSMPEASPSYGMPGL